MKEFNGRTAYQKRANGILIVVWHHLHRNRRGIVSLSSHSHPFTVAFVLCLASHKRVYFFLLVAVAR